VNGWDCLDPSATEDQVVTRHRQAQSAATVLSSKNTETRTRRTASDTTSEDPYDTIQTILLDDCAFEMEACFGDRECGHLFMVGSSSPSSFLLQELIKCIEDFDGVGGEDFFRASLVTDDDNVGICIAKRCQAEYLLCQVSVECALGEETDRKVSLEACIEEYCVFTQTPTLSPTARQSVLSGSVGGSVGLLFEIEGGATFEVPFKYITAGNLQVVPSDGSTLDGHVVVTASCDPAGEGAASLDGAILFVKRGCNVYDMVRAAENFGAVMVVFADDVAAKSTWVPRDRTLSLPVLSAGYAAAEAMQTMVRRGKQIRGSLASNQYCDVMHASGLDTSSPTESVGGEKCCVAGDIITSHLLYQHDFWNVGVRDFPFCRKGSADEDMTMECAEPHDVVPADVSTVCMDLCKRNGVCEDGGANSEGHSCPWGGDCQDCGPRELASIASEDTEDIAYGRPATSEYDAAVEFMCNSAEGFYCQGALVSKYTDFHGDRNVYTAAIRALCLDTSCALQNSVLKYALSYRSGVPCCFAAQVAVAHILEQAYGEHDLSPFAGVCLNDLGAEADFNLSCNGTVPLLNPNSFHLAKQMLCSRDCMGIAEQMLLDIRQKARSDLTEIWPVVFHFPLVQETCGSTLELELEVCTLLPFAEYVAAETLLGTGMACCEASGIIIADLLRQADRGRFHRDLCPTGCNGIVGKIDGMLGTAKSTLQSVATCATTTFAVFESVDTSGDVSKEQFKKYIKNDNICWLEWSLASVPIESVPTSGCEAADIVLAQHLRLYEPAIAPDVYEQAFNRSLDDEAVARAISAICNNAWGEALDARLKVDAGSLFGDFSFQSKCENSCRCKTDFDGVEMPLVKVGCGLPPDNDEQEPTGSRPYCYVVDPASCTTSVASSIVGLDGESWTFCSVGYDTCQMYNGAEGPCAPFVPAGASIFVPAGATLESLQFLGEGIHGDSSANELLGLAGDGNWLSVWLLEAGLVSSDCYATHGRRVCDARLRRCENADQVPQPLPVCRADCAKAFSRSADASCNEVFSDTLRDIDGGVVCEWRLLPTGFSGLNGLQHGDGGE
jgi:hypothetical protein